MQEQKTIIWCILFEQKQEIQLIIQTIARNGYSKTMSSQQPLQVFPNKGDETIMEEIPILYLWFGDSVPEDYLISLSELDYPVIFLKNPKIKRKFSRELLDIEKSDYYRLWYLYEHGGIYSDFDNTINYNCLIKLLQPYSNQDKLVFMTDGKHTRQKTQQITTNLIYAPKPKLPILSKMLGSIDESKEKVWQFAGIKFVGQFEEPIELNMSKCVQHSYDWSWYKASNQVLGLNAGPHSHYAKKLVKKSQILFQKQRLQTALKDLSFQLGVLRNDLRRISNDNIGLKNEMLEIHDKILSICPSAQKILDQYDNCLSNPTNDHQTRNTQQEEISFNCEELKLWNKVSQISDQNKRLKEENKALKWQIFGGITIFVIVLVLIFFVIRKKKATEFKRVDLVENTNFS